MSDTSGLPNTDAEGVPAEDKPERFDGDRDAQSAEPAETEQGQSEQGQSEQGQAGQGQTSRVSEPHETGIAPEGAEDVTAADNGGDQAAPPPADFDPADQPSNPDLVGHSEPPD